MPTPETMRKYCPIIKPVSLIGDFWTLLIVKELLDGPKRFNLIKEALPEITSRTLSAKLKNMVENDVVKRTQLEGSPPGVEYSLTSLGHGLRPVVKSIEEFGNQFLCEI
jgi:DNA-binding HxlR family transcriptional regulator